ncbi:hypothetical protein AMK59_2110 [Oryctes borbonicus]|uniref:Uncharacterized protein n=1 Tax=Oryctes borbonicus TaxID=1629725 RepID=A0A0T6BGF1_9SCAR|nr:hypothetical protein AMK59_2110 [Oryctes borbonicus]
MESLNSNELSNEILTEGPASPILNSSKINSRLYITKRKQKNKLKSTSQSLNDKQLNTNSTQDDTTIENRLKTIEVLGNERRKYYSEMCNKSSGIKTIQTAENKCNINLSAQQNFKSKNCESQRSYNIPQYIESFNVQTASGKKVEIPENIIAEHKYIFDDILNGDHLLNPVVLKYPIKGKMKVSKIPVFNRNTKFKNENDLGGARSIKDSKAKTINQQLSIMKKVASEELDDPFDLTASDKDNMLKSSSSDVTVIESVAENAMHVTNNKEILNEEQLSAKYHSSSDTMNKLYSNQKFEECSTSTNSLEICALRESERGDSELSMGMSQAMCNAIIKPSYYSNIKKITNQLIGITPDEFSEFSILDIINDDWSDTYFGENQIKNAILLDNRNNVANTTKIVDLDNEAIRTIDTVKITDNSNNNKHITTDEMSTTKQVGNSQLAKQATRSDVKSKKMSEFCNNYSNNSHLAITKLTKEDHKEPAGYETEQKLYDQQSIVSSKSLIHVSIPSYKYNHEDQLYSKNLIELHRNRNYTIHSEDSVSNLNYKSSHHTMQLRKRILKAQKKIINTDFIGFDKKTQNIANKKALAFAATLKEMEKQIFNTEAVIQEHSKESRKKEKKKKKHKPVLHDEKISEKEKDQSLLDKNKSDKKKRDKSKVNGVTEETPENSPKKIIQNEKTNKAIPHDHVSINSEQSCKKHKIHNKRKTTTTDKELVHENQNTNQIIEVSPNNKKFKIEIDCNSKFRINICCNGVPNIESGYGKDKSDREAIKFHTENVGINFKPIENFTVKTMFKSASGKDITTNKTFLADAEQKFEHIDSNFPNEEESSVQNTLAKITNTERNKKYNSINSPNANNKDKLIKKFMDKGHKLYSDMRKSDVSLNQEKMVEKVTDNDLNTNYQVNGNQDVTSNNNCGFKLASGKDMKISEKAMKNAQKMYREIEEISAKNLVKGNINDTSANQNVNNISPKLKRTKQKTRVLCSDINNCNLNDVIVTGKLTKNKNNAKHKDVSLKINQKQLDKNQPPVVEMTNFSRGFKSAGGKNINISPTALEKAKRLFDDTRPAGDSTHQTLLFSDIDNTCKAKTDSPEKHLTDSKIPYAQGDHTKFCMGDFQNDDSKMAPKQNDVGSTPVNASGSKRAFELLEDVVETVDCALERIKKTKLYKPSNVRRRLGISRCKQINISREKIHKAKRLFSYENFAETVRDLSVITSPKNCHIGASSTPIKENASQIADIRFYMNTVESEITPIKNQLPEKNNDTVITETAPIVIQDRTPGTLDDWYATVLKQITTLKDVLKDLENKKSCFEKQMSFVYYGSKEHRRQRAGVLYGKKASHTPKVPLKSIEINKDNNNVQDIMMSVTFQNADMIHFNSASSEYAGRTEDGAFIIPNAQNLVGLSEIEMAFRTMIGVEPTLIPDGWVANHYRLIVWKLASYERFFSGQLSGCLTLENIVQQLKYRYDREIDRAQRPAIRKILEKDDVSQKRMVLCVSSIIEVPKNGIELELTDGWYCIRTLIDNPLVAAVRRKKIKVGTKLIVCGAQLLNCDGCHPLQVTDFVKLKVTYNSTRRAIWDAKLGYQRCPEPFAIPLSSIHPNGGVIGCIKVHILRVYPIRYMEQIDDKKGTVTIYI